jgi:hypothetical protein
MAAYLQMIPGRSFHRSLMMKLQLLLYNQLIKRGLRAWAGHEVQVALVLGDTASWKPAGDRRSVSIDAKALSSSAAQSGFAIAA